MTDADCGVLLIGHGTREPSGRDEFARLATAVALRLAPQPVVPAYLEAGEPTIAEGCELLAARGVERIAVVPLLLFAAGHAKRDIPQAVEEARRRWPRCQFTLAGHLGNHPAIVELSRRRYQEALESVGAAVAEPTTGLVLIGRGSRDAAATGEMEELCRLRGERPDRAAVSMGFVALAEPTLAAALDAAAATSAARIVVQPHFLFAGVLVDRIKAAVRQRAWHDRAQRWIVAEHLGPHPLIVAAVEDRLRAVRRDRPETNARNSKRPTSLDRMKAVAPATMADRE